MPHALRTIARRHGWIHTGLGLVGNVLFFIGSILFLPAMSEFKTLGVFLFITGSFLMLVGTLGDAIADLVPTE